MANYDVSAIAFGNDTYNLITNNSVIDDTCQDIAEPIPYDIDGNGVILVSNGVKASASGYVYTTFINITGYKYIVYSRCDLTSSDPVGGIAFYTGITTGGFISGEAAKGGASAAGYIDKITKIPDNAKYVRLSLHKNISGFYLSGIREKPLSGLKLSLLGDSVSAYTGTVPSGNNFYYLTSNTDTTGVNNVNEMWWNRLCNYTGMDPLIIDGWGGSSICYNYATDSSHSDTDIIPMCSDLRTGRLSSNGVDPDVIIVAGGTNDWTYSASTTTPLGDWNGRTAINRTQVTSGQSTFMESYASLINKLHENYPSAVVVCLSLFYTRRGTDLGCTRVNTMGYTPNDYNNAIEKVCKIMGVPFIDVYNVGFNNDNYYPTYAQDSSSETTHPNALGHAVIAHRIIKELPRITRQIKG